MKKLLLTFLLAVFTVSLQADSWTNQYAQYGNLIVVKLDSAPFPHPDRANGHKQSTNVYTAEKNYSDNTVAILVPNGFRKSDKVDFVVHFHGWGNHVENVLKHYQLVQQFVDAGRNAVLVVPQGPYDARDSFDGKLEDKDGFKRFMGDVMATLRDRGVIGSEPIGDIILSGHSGGYQVISSIVAQGGMSEKVKEVWLFDALYARTDQFMNWFYRYPNRRLIDLYTEHGGTKGETEKLIAAVKVHQPPVSFVSKNESETTAADLKKYSLVFTFTPMEHDHTPYEHQTFAQYLKTSCLPPVK
jgi:hypothetical protein